MSSLPSGNRSSCHDFTGTSRYHYKRIFTNGLYFLGKNHRHRKWCHTFSGVFVTACRDCTVISLIVIGIAVVIVLWLEFWKSWSYTAFGPHSGLWHILEILDTFHNSKLQNHNICCLASEDLQSNLFKAWKSAAVLYYTMFVQLYIDKLNNLAI